MEGNNVQISKEKALLAAYSEVCKSYNALNDASFKLLGLVPFTSLITIALLNNSALATDESLVAKELIGFGGLFVAALVFALFSYEIRGIERCDTLMKAGKELEIALNLKQGQFITCTKQSSPLVKAFNAKNAACFIYSLVIAGWIFIALRLGFDVATNRCIVWSVGLALVIGIFMAWLVRNLLAR